MIKILTIIGARPQIIKAAALSRAINTRFKSKIKEVIVHTGQHYDSNMSAVFFEQLNIPKPDYNLNVGSGSHGAQTATMIAGIEEILYKEKPNCIVLYGDTNSTLAGGIAASKIHIPVVHIEAGLRSYNKAMPEEVNRIMCDHVSTLLFSPTKSGFDNLVKEGFNPEPKAPFTIDNPKIYHCGDVMYDNSMHFAEIAESSTTIIKDLSLVPENFILVTIHRNNNTDEPARLSTLFRVLNDISLKHSLRIVMPLHPRTSKLLEKNLETGLYDKIAQNKLFSIIEPVGFLEIIALEKNCKLVMTDSGGVQKEAFFFKKPCVILRSETEWIELVNNGNAAIADADEARILEAFDRFNAGGTLSFPAFYGNAKASEFICTELLSVFD